MKRKVLVIALGLFVSIALMSFGGGDKESPTITETYMGMITDFEKEGMFDDTDFSLDGRLGDGTFSYVITNLGRVSEEVDLGIESNFGEVKMLGNGGVSLGNQDELSGEFVFDFPEGVNYGEVSFELLNKPIEDREAQNDRVVFDFFGEQDFISEIVLEGRPEGAFDLGISEKTERVPDFDFEKAKFYLIDNKSELESFKLGEGRYGEIYFDEGIAHFMVYQLTERFLKSGNYSEFIVEESKFKPGQMFFVMLPYGDSGLFSVSDVYSFGLENEMNRGEFAKFLVEKLDIEIDSEGIAFYEDVDRESEFFPYVQTLYNSGLLNVDFNLFKVDEAISRGEALVMIMDYLDIDLAGDFEEGFDDLNEIHEVYFYANTMKSDLNFHYFPKSFNPEAPASKEFLNFLIKEYEKFS